MACFWGAISTELRKGEEVPREVDQRPVLDPMRMGFLSYEHMVWVLATFVWCHRLINDGDIGRIPNFLHLLVNLSFQIHYLLIREAETTVNQSESVSAHSPLHDRMERPFSTLCPVVIQLGHTVISRIEQDPKEYLQLAHFNGCKLHGAVCIRSRLEQCTSTTAISWTGFRKPGVPF